MATVHLVCGFLGVGKTTFSKALATGSTIRFSIDALKGAAAPSWARETPALPIPYFASRLHGLRLHLLSNSPAAS